MCLCRVEINKKGIIPRPMLDSSQRALLTTLCTKFTYIVPSNASTDKIFNNLNNILQEAPLPIK